MLSETCALIRQVPEGRVTTYGLVARALGDVCASRFVARALWETDVCGAAPCHRVVRSDGWIRSGVVGDANIGQAEGLRREGVSVSGGKVVGLEARLFSDFSTDRPLLGLRARQAELRKRLVVEEFPTGFDFVAGVDVAYSPDRAFGSLVTFDAESGVETSSEVVEGEAPFPYIPTFLAFRELPVLEPLLRAMESGTLLMYDGNGVLHPEGFGVASHAGVEFDVPTVGVAKKLLCGSLGRENRSGAREVMVGDRLSGYSVAHEAGRRPVFVSPGHMTSFRQALNVTRKFMRRRVPEPTRRAHAVAESARRATSHK